MLATGCVCSAPFYSVNLVCVRGQQQGVSMRCHGQVLRMLTYLFATIVLPVILAALLQVALPWECSEGGARMHIACATTWNWMAVHNHVPRTI